MRHDPQTPAIDNKQREEGSRTDVEREKAKAGLANEARDNARKLGETPKGTPDAQDGGNDAAR